MGLTIHYALKSKVNAASQARTIVNRILELARDLPFERVGDVVDLRGKDLDHEARRAELQTNGGEDGQSLLWMLIQAGQSVVCPWNKHRSRRVDPTRMIAFDAWPGRGCEAANIGLCQYPTEIEWDYKQEDDFKFFVKGPDDWPRFSYDKWSRWRYRTGNRGYPSETEKRMVPTKLSGWYWSSFCKTQYASNPACGGIPNFLRCHISVIELLERAAKIPSLSVRISDEGDYGPHTACDNYREADAAGEKRVYRRKKGKYSPVLLANEVGERNSMIAAFAGAMSDALQRHDKELVVSSPIKNFQNFEQLEFRGRNKKLVGPFLEVVANLAKSASTKA